MAPFLVCAAVPVSAEGERHLPTTVWLSRWHPTDPDRAFIESGLERWTDFAFVTTWLFAAALVLVVGRVRQLVRRRRRSAGLLARTFGTGLDPEMVQRLLAERRRPPQRPSQE